MFGNLKPLVFPAFVAAKPSTILAHFSNGVVVVGLNLPEVSTELSSRD